MVFSSFSFLCVFLPVLFLLYMLIPTIRAKNYLLLLFSLFFYAYGEPVFVFLMIGSVFVNYLLAVWLVRWEIKKRAVLALGIVFNLLFLGVFKYAGFFVQTLNELPGVSLPVPDITLPIGISFFTFQVMSYLVDVYRQPELLERNFSKVLLYVSFFPQLIAGPIVKYHDVMRYISERKQNPEQVYRGLKRFIIGLAKKVLLANTVGQITDMVFALGMDAVPMPLAWLCAVSYLFQIYFDFSGYSDMAIGLGAMFGFSFKENFDVPYTAVSIRDFWHRWHISLSTWFKEYLYIPLGGNRKGNLCKWRNNLIVFFCTGLWHGASWNFVVWGMIHGVAIVLEDIFHIPERLKKLPVLGWIYTIWIVLFAFVLFRADSLSQGMDLIHQMFTGAFMTDGARQTMAAVLTPYNLFILGMCVVLSLPVKKILQKRETIDKFLKGNCYEVLTACSCLLLLSASLFCLAGASYNPFIYFRF